MIIKINSHSLKYHYSSENIFEFGIFDSVSEHNLKHDVIGYQKQMGLYIPKENLCASQKQKYLS